MKTRQRFVFVCLQLFLLQTAYAISDSRLTKIKQGFEMRRNEAFESMKGNPLIIHPKLDPLEPGRPLYTRHFNYSLIDFAFRSFWLNEQIDVANKALDENTAYYTNNLPAMKDRDSFYWAADELTRIIEFFGSKGSRRSDLLSDSTEANIYEMMWQYASTFSQIAKAEYKISKTWFIEESENHHAQRVATYWHFSKLLKEHPGYKNRQYNDHFYPSDHYEAWNEYCKQWIVERAKKGLFIEMANESYGLETLKGIYNFYDFGDTQLRRLSGMLLDLYWATWAEEQIQGVRGGSKNRVYPGIHSKSGRGNFWKMAWYYFGMTEPGQLKENLFTLVTSQYTPALVVMDIALDTKGKGVYEIKQRRPGLAVPGYFAPPDYRLISESGGIVRYSYCTPEFIIGTAHFDALPYTAWTMISSQNRWQGIIFKENPDARIFPQCSDNTTFRSLNQHWSAQHKGCLITQKLPDNRFASHSRPMRVFFSKAGLGNVTEKNGWVFLSTKSAYVAVKCVSKAYTWETDTDGKWMLCDDENTPVILQVGRKKQFESYNKFQKKVQSLPIHFDGKVLSFRSIYDDHFLFNSDFSKLARINDTPIAIDPPMVFDSPFIKSIFNSGVVEISKDKRKLILDFTK